MDFAKTYGSKVIARNTYQDVDAFVVETEDTNSWVSCKYDELIAKQAAKMKEQAATARELTLEFEVA